MQHIAIEHEIKDVEQFEDKFRLLQKATKKQHEFIALVGQLKEQRTKGLISAEEYRDRIADWLRNWRGNDADSN